jgi:hypothetical protein
MDIDLNFLNAFTKRKGFIHLMAGFLYAAVSFYQI